MKNRLWLIGLILIMVSTLSCIKTPQIKSQWFVKMAPLAKKAGDAVRANKISFIPGNYKKIFLYFIQYIFKH